MKRYKLLKDLPTFKAGEEFFISESGNLIAGTPRNPKQITVETTYGLPTKIDLMVYAQETLEEFPNILKDWFEEIKEEEKPKKYFYIGSMGHIESDEPRGWELSLSLRKMIGNHFETKEETEAYLTYLKAKAIIKQDTKGFKPDWNDEEEDKFFGYWDFKQEKVDYSLVFYIKRADIYFKTLKDIKESLEKHPIEWRTYLSYEQ